MKSGYMLFTIRRNSEAVVNILQLKQGAQLGAHTCWAGRYDATRHLRYLDWGAVWPAMPAPCSGRLLPT